VLEIYCRAPLPPTEDWLEFLDNLAAHTALAIESARQFEELQKKVLELGVSSDLAIEAWMRALEISGRENREHVRRVADLTVEIARKLKVGEGEIVNMRRGALLHDVGLFGIPETILLKAGSLTAEERAIVQEHPDLALHLLQPLPHLALALDIPRSHHERWDGSGYPEGLKGEEIPLAARIFAVVDVFDALTSTRPYRPAWSQKEALEYIRQQAGVGFDPRVVEAFLAVMEGADRPQPR
jgi:HD-GYP domain-containing protein (c-di-GMP phosphodiesterase class II)